MLLGDAGSPAATIPGSHEPRPWTVMGSVSPDLASLWLPVHGLPAAGEGRCLKHAPCPVFCLLLPGHGSSTEQRRRLLTLVQGL